MKATRNVVALFTVATLACSAKGDLEKICNAEQLSGAASIADPSMKATKMAEWLSNNLRSSEGKNVMQALAMVSPDDKGKILRQAAKEVGYDGPCPMADGMNAGAKEAPVPPPVPPPMPTPPPGAPAN